MAKKILVIGSGGREHALCWKLAQSDHVDKIYCAPGNGGTTTTSKTQNIPIEISDFKALIGFVEEQQIDLTVVGPDNALADGIVDAFQAAGLRIFGPTQQAARLESSKVFSKQFMREHSLPTASFEVFDNLLNALAFCKATEWARVIKVDGLALGKGVYVCETLAECESALRDIFETKRFGASGTRVVVEERLFGPEVSLMVLCDGETMRAFTSSQDYKRRYDGNKGPNTGGMGAYSPVPFYADYRNTVEQAILKPLEEALRSEAWSFKGLLYVGLMFHEDKPYILEFNARFGDPETQCLLPRLENDLLELFEACIDGTLHQHQLLWDEQAATCIVICADTYPDQGSKDVPIRIDALPSDVMLFQAGTRRTDAGELVTHGGRVLNLVALGSSPEQAAQRAYAALPAIHFEGMAYRADIAKDVSVCLLK